MIVVLIILAVIAGFAAFLAVRAALCGSRAELRADRKEYFSEEKYLEYAKKLSFFIKCKTVSHRNSYDDEEFGKLRFIVEKLFPVLHERCKRTIAGDDCWIYRIAGEDRNRNILLMSHHDVVAENGEWKHPAFEGEIIDGKIWGRGTVDTKTSLFAALQAAEELLEQGVIPPCNVYIASSHNEEQSGDGIVKAVEYFKSLGVHFELVVDEGGAIIEPLIKGMTQSLAMIATHEKGRKQLICTAERPLDGGSLTKKVKSPVVSLSEFIAAVSKKPPVKPVIPREIPRMMNDVAPYLPFLPRMLAASFDVLAPVVKIVVPRAVPAAEPMFTSTFGFSGVCSHDDGSCCVKVMMRYTDDETYRADYGAFMKLAQKYGITVTDGEIDEKYNPVDFDSAGYKYVTECVEKVFPNAVPAPYLLTAGTDARHLSPIADCVIKFAPIILSVSQLSSVHCTNENIGINSVGDAVVFYRELIENYR